MSRAVAVRPPQHGLRVAVAGGVARLTIERPAAGNRITPELAQALCDAAEAIELDNSIVGVVLAATGPHFCLGVESPGRWEPGLDWVESMARLSRPVIAALHGDAIAEGLELALACDLRVVSSRAHFAMPQLASGRIPSHGGTQRLPRIVGRMRALDLLLTGRRIDATEAETIGLASRVVPHRQMGRAVNGLVTELLSKGPIALRYAKEAILKGGDMTLDQGIRLEEDLYVLLQTTADRRAGVEAFLRKRKAVFEGK